MLANSVAPNWLNNGFKVENLNFLAEHVFGRIEAFSSGEADKQICKNTTRTVYVYTCARTPQISK
jgi:hypothetical protein